MTAYDGGMRQKRFLLVTAALSTVAATEACGKDPVAKPETTDGREISPLPANPKGSYYDAGLATPEPPPRPPPTTAETDAGRVIPRLPANPKGSHYDAGLNKKKTGPEF